MGTCWLSLAINTNQEYKELWIDSYQVTKTKTVQQNAGEGRD